MQPRLRQWQILAAEGKGQETDSDAMSTGIHIGSHVVDERALNTKLDVVRRSIKTWATRRQLWHDAEFKTPYIHNNECPRSGDVLYLTFEGPLHRVFSLGFNARDSKYREQFFKLLSDLGFEYDMVDHVTMTIFPTDERTQDAYLTLYRWQWLQHLAALRLLDIHGEVFEFFAGHPDRLKKLGWRQFEEFLDAVFKNQGFYTELGPGRNDGGVDLRLYQSQAVPELVTVVQAKRYTQRPIQLESVAALFGIAVQERAARGIMATTSRFLPQAKKFASSTQKRLDVPSIELADSRRVGVWCADIAQQLNDFFSTGTTMPRLLANHSPTSLSGRIVVSQGGYNTTQNYFAVVEFDFQHEAILRPIGREIVSGDLQIGSEIPKEGACATWTEAIRFVAFKTRSAYSDREHFWGDRRLFSLWDGFPLFFNTMD